MHHKLSGVFAPTKPVKLCPSFKSRIATDMGKSVPSPIHLIPLLMTYSYTVLSLEYMYILSLIVLGHFHYMHYIEFVLPVLNKTSVLGTIHKVVRLYLRK